MSEDNERIKRKNLLQSYYNQNANENTSLGASGDSIQNNKTTASSSSLTMSNVTNSSYNSNDHSTGQSNQNLNSNNSNNIQIHLKDPFDINSTVFEPDLFLKRLIKVIFHHSKISRFFLS